MEHKDENTFLEMAKDRALGTLASGTPMEQLPIPQQTIAIIYTAHGILGNGGLQYFFEADFPGSPSYSIFVEAYERIGATDCAAALRDAVALFDFVDPERHVKKRNRYLNRWQKAATSPLKDLDAVLCGNKKVWKLLEIYAAKHRAELSMRDMS